MAIKNHHSWLPIAVVLISTHLSLVCAVPGQFSFSSYFADNMVLQRGPARAQIWGYAASVDVGSTVTLTFKQQEYSTIVDEDETWTVMLPAETAEGPYEISVDLEGSSTSLKLSNILFGDVYICSGQSNMNHLLRNIDNSDQEISISGNYDKLRLFQAATNFADEPQRDLLGITRQWTRPDASNVGTFSAVCWLYAKNVFDQVGVPMGLVQSAWGGTRIEAWSSSEANDLCFDDGPPSGSDKNQANVLYNAMIHPFLPMTITGVLWYQGEANAGRPTDYTCSLPVMINDWRERFYDGSNQQTDPQFPFGQVQLAPNTAGDSDTGFPDLRWSQTAEKGVTPNQQLPNVFTAVAMDTPDFDGPHGSIHPQWKRQPAKRLSYGGLSLVYNMPTRYNGPFPTSIVRADDVVTLTYDNGDVVLDIREEGAATGFEVCCSDVNVDDCPSGSTWSEASVTGSTESSISIRVSCTSEQFVAQVRYAWRVSPCPVLEQCLIYSVENDLPAAPFKLPLF